MAARRTRSPARSKAAREFVSEVEEILERLRGDLADLADERSHGTCDPDRVNQLFRSAHSLKGLAGMFGFEGMSDLAHHLEDILDGLRMGRVPIDSPALGLLDPAVDLIASLLGRVGSRQAQTAARDEIAAMIEQIEVALAAPVPQAGPADDPPGIDESILRALTEYEEHRLHESLARGRLIHLVEASFDILSFEDGLSELTASVREVGEVISTLPAPGAVPESQIRFSLLVTSDSSVDELRSRVDFPSAEVRCVSSSAPGAASARERQAPQGNARSDPQAAGSAGRSETPASDHRRAASVPAIDPPEPEVADPRHGEAQPLGSPAHSADPASELESLKSISETVRVDIRKLDELMNLVGELVIQRGAIGAIAARMLHDPATARLGNELTKVHKALDRKLQDLQAGVLEVRMVPLRQVFEKLSRVVRRLRRDSGKDVRLEILGGDTELDKLIVEDLADPLMHVVRNAFDHAIEDPGERVAAGKPAAGSIRLRALQRGNHVVIEVADDGRGIDLEAVRACAVEQGRIPADAPLSKRDAMDLVFLPGLSTRAEVTETSGRGVGMDVARANVTALGGLVHLDSTPGRGTQVCFTLPITLAIIQALIVGVGDQRFAIPLTSVLETLLVDPSQVQRSEGREFLRLRGEPLVLRHLDAEFGLPPAAPDARRSVVVVGLGDARAGLLVDRLEGQQDAVIKPIQGPVRSLRGIAGATELGDAGAVLVLDIAPLVEDSTKRREAA